MKKLTLLLLLSIFSLAAVIAQNKEVQTGPVGVWKFDAPYAPEGYTSGIIAIILAEKKYSATMSFTGTETKLTGDRVKVLNDSIFFSVYVEGQDVAVKLKLDAETKMSGKAVYTEGVVPLALTKLATAGEAKK
jgi:hypothetical protein